MVCLTMIIEVTVIAKDEMKFNIEKSSIYAVEYLFIYYAEIINF